MSQMMYVGGFDIKVRTKQTKRAFFNGFYQDDEVGTRGFAGTSRKRVEWSGSWANHATVSSVPRLVSM